MADRDGQSGKVFTLDEDATKLFSAAMKDEGIMRAGFVSQAVNLGTEEPEKRTY